MLKDYAAGKFDVIVGWKLDRILSRVGSLVDMVRDAPDVRFCTTDLGVIDLTTSDGRHRAIDAANDAEFESARKGERERRANRQHAEQGRPKRPAQRCFGYTTTLEVVPEEAAVVREAFAAHLAGYPLNAILRTINGEDGDPTPEGLLHAVKRLPERQTWSRTRLRYLLVNPRYAGLVALVPAPADTRQTRPQRIAVIADSLVLDRDENPVHGRWEPIVDEATWRESLRLMRSRALGHVGSDRRYFGTGIFRCGVCGGPLFVSASSYRCPTVGHVSRRREPIDKLVLATVRERLARGDMAGLLPHEDDGRMTEIREELTKCESELARIRDDYRAHLIDGAFYAELREELTARRDAALAERDRLTRDPTGGVLTCDDPVAAFDAIAKDPVRLHAIVDYLLEVTIHPDPRNGRFGHRGFRYEGIDIKWKRH